MIKINSATKMKSVPKYTIKMDVIMMLTSEIRVNEKSP
jgi:hypothetical protein